MYNVGDIGYIYYKEKVLEIKILEVHGPYYIVQTEEGEILGIPPESSTRIWKTKEDYEIYEAWKGYTLVPQGE